MRVYHPTGFALTAVFWGAMIEMPGNLKKFEAVSVAWTGPRCEIVTVEFLIWVKRMRWRSQRT